MYRIVPMFCLRGVVSVCLAAAVWLGTATGVRAALPNPNDAFTLLPLLGPAEVLGSGGPTLTELGAAGVVVNPAAVFHLPKKSLLLSLGKGDTEGSNFLFSYAIPDKGWSVGYESLSLGDLYGTSDFNIGYARRVGGRFPLGVRLHFYNESVNKTDRSGYGVDVTSLLVDDDGFSYGVGLRNLLSSVDAANANVPTLFTSGVRFQPRGAAWSLKGAYTKNFQRQAGNFSQFTVGGEYALTDQFTLQAGLQYKDLLGVGTDRAATFGLGYRADSGMALNYGAVLRDDTFGTLHRLDFTTAFNGGQGKKADPTPTVREAKLPPEPIRVALNTIVDAQGRRIALIVDEQGVAIDNQEAPFVSVRTWGPEKAKAGDTIDLTVVFENLGKTEAHNLQIFTNLPDGTKVKSHKAIGLDTDQVLFRDLGHKLLWGLNTLPAGSYGELNVTLAIDKNFSGEEIAFFSEAGYEDLEQQPYISQESNVTTVALEGKPVPPKKDQLIAKYELTSDTILLNTDTTPAYQDIQNHWAERDVDAMKTMGLLSNFPGPYFYPDRPLDERRFYEMLILAQIYQRFQQPLTIQVTVEENVALEVFLVPVGQEQGQFLLEQKFQKGGQYTLALERAFLEDFAIVPGSYELVLQAKSSGVDPDIQSKPVKVLGSLVDLSPAFFEGRELSYEDGIQKLVAIYGQGNIDATYLLNLTDGTHTINRLGAVKAILKALGIHISEDDVAAFKAIAPFHGNDEEIYHRLLLTLASQPIAAREDKGFLDSVNPLNPGGEEFLSRAQGAVMIHRYLAADPIDYRPMDVLAKMEVAIPSGAKGGAPFRLTAGSFITRRHAQDIAEYFKDYHAVAAKVVREWVGTRHVYTVVLAAGVTRSAGAELAERYGKARYPVHLLAIQPTHKMKPAPSRYALSPDQLEDLRQEKLAGSMPLNLPSVTEAERPSQPFHFDIEPN